MIANLWRTVAAIFKPVPAPVADPAPTVEPEKTRRGRPRTYDPNRPASGAERMRRARWKEQRKTPRGTRDENHFRHRDENTLLKEEEKKEGAGAPISKDWRPDPESVRLGKEVFGDEYEVQLADHIDWCLKTDYRCHDHDAQWRKRCRYFKRNPQLLLPLQPRARQLGVKDCEIIEPRKKRGGWRRRNRSIADAADELIAYARQRQGIEPAPQRERMRDVTPADVAPAPASEEDKAKVQAKLDWFRRGQSKEASG